MVTIKAANDLHQVPEKARVNATLTRFAQWKRDVAKWWYNSSIAEVLCCVDAGDYEAALADERVRNDIRREMLRTQNYRGYGNGVVAAIASVRAELGYEMSMPEEVVNAGSVDSLAVDVSSREDTPQEVEGVANTSDLGAELVEYAEQQQRVCVVPRFAAAIALHLRSRLGRMAPSEANQLLMEREYNRLCRNYRVRDVDIAAHYSYVKNAYFGEQVFDRIPTGRTRLSRFARWALSFDDMPRAPPQVC